MKKYCGYVITDSDRRPPNHRFEAHLDDGTPSIFGKDIKDLYQEIMDRRSDEMDEALSLVINKFTDKEFCEEMDKAKILLMSHGLSLPGMFMEYGVCLHISRKAR